MWHSYAKSRCQPQRQNRFDQSRNVWRGCLSHEPPQNLCYVCPISGVLIILLISSQKTSWRRGARNGVRHSTEDIPSKLKYFLSPICVAEHLAPFLPSHPIITVGGERPIDAVSAAPWGSASILLISWAYIKMLGGQGLVDSSKIALLSANYMAYRLSGHYSLRYKNANGRVAHELLIDFAEFDKSAGLKVTDFAKRLQVNHD